MRLLPAFLAAVLVPTSIVVAMYLSWQFQTFGSADPYIWTRTRNFAIICLTISTAYVVALGIPAYGLLRWRNAIRWWSTVAMGFLLGAIPPAVLFWPLRNDDSKIPSSVDGVQTMIEGMPTATGGMQFLAGITTFAALGAVGGLAFWLVARGRLDRS